MYEDGQEETDSRQKRGPSIKSALHANVPSAGIFFFFSRVGGGDVDAVSPLAKAALGKCPPWAGAAQPAGTTQSPLGMPFKPTSLSPLSSYAETRSGGPAPSISLGPPRTGSGEQPVSAGMQ